MGEGGEYSVTLQSAAIKTRVVTVDLAATLLAVAVVVLHSLVLLLPMDQLIGHGWLSDDAFYYFRIARNVALGIGPSFDGVTLTNGFQPLWLLILVPVYWFLPNDLELPVRVILGMQIVMLGMCLYCTYLLLTKLGASKTASLLGSVMLLWPGFARSLTGGLESPLVILLSLMALNVVRIVLQSGYKFSVPGWMLANLAIGTCLGLLLLARLDQVFLVTVLGLYYFLHGKWGNGERTALMFRLKGAMLVVASLSLVIIPYFTWNLVRFGHLMPISGALKNSFPSLEFHGSYFLKFPDHAGTAILLALFLLGYLTTSLYRRLAGRHSVSDLQRPCVRFLAEILVVVSLGVVLHWLNTVLFMRWAVFDWHFTIYGLGAAFMAAWVYDHTATWSRRSATVLFCLATAFVGMGLTFSCYRSLMTEGWTSGTYQAALFVRDYLPPDVRLGVRDAGILGYFSERAVFNLDGVANNYEYQYLLRDGKLAEYIIDHGISFLAQGIYTDSPVGERVVSGSYQVFCLGLKSHLFGTTTPVALPSDMEIWRSSIYSGKAKSKGVIVIWRLDPRLVGACP